MRTSRTLNRRSLTRYLLQAVTLGAIASVGVFIFTVREDTWEQIRQFHWPLLPVLFGTVFLAWACNGGRIMILSRALGYNLKFRQAIAVSMSAEFGIAATPAGVGGTVLRLALLRQANIPLTKGGSMLAADVAVDLAFFTLITPIAIFVILKDPFFGGLLQEADDLHVIGAISAVVLITVGLVFLISRPRVQRAIQRRAGSFAYGRRKRWPARIRSVRWAAARSTRRVITSLRFIFLRRRGALIIDFIFASIQWCCRYSLLPLVLFAFGTTANPFPLFLIQGILFSLSLVFVLPGGGGSVEIFAGILLPQFTSLALVGVVMMTWRFFSYHLYLLGGGLVFFWTCSRLNRVFPQRENIEPASSLGVDLEGRS
jgi:uncharacterized protein (TIRG00374 family)